MPTHPKTANPRPQSDRPWREPRVGLSIGAMAVLRAINAGEHAPQTLAVAAKAHIAGKHVANLMAYLARGGFIVRGRGGLCHLTNKGREELPSAVPRFAMGQYTPPAPAYRRPGSDHSHVPSIAAGRAMEYRAHV